jgi:phage terminase large subunit
MAVKSENAILQVLKQKSERKEFVRSVRGSGYDEFWDNKNRYRVVKGGRGSKKSTTTALWFIENIMLNRLSNAVVIRKTGNTHKDSTFAQLKWAANQLKVYDKWKFIEHPMEATYTPTNQKILFRAFDDPMKLTSMTVPKGHLCWAWYEEFFEIDDEQAFDTFDESIRGELPSHLWHQLTITYNPWINNHFSKRRFWDCENPPDTFRLTTIHKCNEWLSQKDHDRIEALAVTNPQRYKVVGLGEYGIPGGVFFDEFREDIHVCKPFDIPSHWHKYTTKDYGLDMLANYWIAIDEQNNGYVYKELHKPNLIISEAARQINAVNNGDKIIIKYAPPDLGARRQETGKSALDIFRENGEVCIRARNDREDGWLAVKEWIAPIETKDIETGEPKMTSRLKIFSTCKNLINSFQEATADKDNLNDVAKEPHHLTHSLDAIRYYCIMRQRPTPIQQKEQRDDFGIYARNDDYDSYFGGEPSDAYIG